jgi:hypothetical protein
MTPETRVFHLTEEQLTASRTKLSNDFGIHLIGENGTINKDGAKASYDIARNINDIEDQVSVTITIEELPVFTSPQFAWSKIAGTFNEAIKQFPTKAAK